MWLSEAEAPLPRITNVYIPAAFVRNEINIPFPQESTNTMWYRPGEVYPIVEYAVFIFQIGTDR